MKTGANSVIPGLPCDGSRVAPHLLDEQAVEAWLATGREGLTEEEARRRLERCGPNWLEDAPPPSDFVLVLHQFQSPLIYILLAAAGVSLALGELVDALVIAAILILNAVIGFLQERQADRSVRALQGLAAPRARVVRGGLEADRESADLVPGDLVLLESGNRVPADVRLVASTALQVDESLLTGESAPVVKRAALLVDPDTPLADRCNMVWAGTIVTSGRGRGYVVATGLHSELGTIAARVSGEEAPETPLQQRLARFARQIGLVVVAAAMLAFGIGVATGERAGEMFLVAVALAVGAIPEGLPVVFTITLARGVRHMARRNAIVRRLPAVETLGSTTVIGADKTGTLTENRMTVVHCWAGSRSIDVADARPLAEEPSLYQLLLAGVLANEAVATTGPDGTCYQGDPTETALLAAAERLGVNVEGERQAWDLVVNVPYEPERQFSAALRESDGRRVVFVKGAPERVLAMSNPSAADREEVEAALRALATRGLRVLACASGGVDDIPDEPPDDWQPRDLSFLGLYALMDPPRAGVRESVAACQRAGMRVVMITGDHAETARAIGEQLGILANGGRVLTGVELDRLDDAELEHVVAETPVCARVTPEHKLRVVKALQRRGEVVAVTGDGINDAPALKAADIGIAMGRGGTDVAREAADMVLTDDNFVSIRGAVEEGRVTFDNIRKSIFFLLSSNTAEVLTILAALALGWPLPLLVVQILWLNLVTDGLQSVALAFEPGDPGVLDRPPRRRDEGLLSRVLWERLALSGVLMALGTLALFRWELRHGASESVAQTVALTTLVLFQTVQAGNARSEHRLLSRMNPLANPFLALGAVAALAVHVVALYLSATQYLLGVEPVDLASWVRMLAVAVSLFVAVEVHKLLRSPARCHPG